MNSGNTRNNLGPIHTGRAICRQFLWCCLLLVWTLAFTTEGGCLSCHLASRPVWIGPSVLFRKTTNPLCFALTLSFFLGTSHIKHGLLNEAWKPWGHFRSVHIQVACMHCHRETGTHSPQLCVYSQVSHCHLYLCSSCVSESCITHQSTCTPRPRLKVLRSAVNYCDQNPATGTSHLIRNSNAKWNSFE